eukprot:GHVU01048491.1.p1 GENE.GHVU01048491.1~~GHVU01048491.1.p1  ORF type:complete len:335 (-),score=80.01 GHVU01048491.1:1550-2554(-)
MGGHGGLNILPQKRWHVYRWDNRLKVEKDERHAKEKADRKKRKCREEASTDRIRQLKRRAGDHREPEVPDGALERAQVEESENEIQEKEEKRRKKRKFNNGQPADEGDGAVSKEGPKHMNFFEEEEKQLLQAEREHRKYLREVGHKARETKSDFDAMNSLKPWYMQISSPSLIREGGGGDNAATQNTLKKGGESVAASVVTEGLKGSLLLIRSELSSGSHDEHKDKSKREVQRKTKIKTLKKQLKKLKKRYQKHKRRARASSSDDDDDEDEGGDDDGDSDSVSSERRRRRSSRDKRGSLPSMEEMMKERTAREEAERKRAAEVMAAANVAQALQ